MPLFGNEMAEYDSERLYDCYIPEKTLEDIMREKKEVIITGKWGSGKTAYILKYNKDLDDLLPKSSFKNKRMWFIDSTSIDTAALNAVKDKLHSNYSEIIRAFEKVWFAEILRTECQILSQFKTHYNYPNTKHWKIIVKKSFLFNKYDFFWKSINSLVDIIFRKVDSLSGIQSDFNELVSDKVFQSIQKCLFEIKEKEIQPIIAIEPIESPNTDIELKLGLARPLVISLINTFRNYFIRDETQLIRVILVIPWHLIPVYYSSTTWDKDSWEEFYGLQVDRPQHIYQYINEIECDKKRLYKLIKARIGWELENVKRKHKGDEWKLLFCEKVRTEQNKKIWFENSFDYVCRYTRHRARDIIRVARECVSEFIKENNIGLKNFLKGYSKSKIDSNTIRRVVVRLNNIFTNDLQTEGMRRHIELNKILAEIYNLKIPCSMKIFEERVKKTGIDIQRAIYILWNCGYLGIEISLNNRISNDKNERIIYIQRITSDLGKDTFIEYKHNRKFIERWFLFQYNFDRNPNYILQDYDSLDYSSAKIIFHPIIFSTFNIKSISDYPIGI